MAIKLGDYLCDVFLPRPPELAHFGFNPSNIMGAIDLYRARGEKRYLDLAGTFVDMRGSQPGGTDQNQAHVALREETDAVGHAVTATYLWCGATDVYAETGDNSLLVALERIWDDVTLCKMYITGGVGPLHHGESIRHDHVHEAFDRDYHLHNATAYNETCANIGNAMWNWRMFTATGETKYADLLEQVLYNTGLSGISLDGKHFCYTNPLRWHGGEQEMLSNDTPARWFIHTCYCCPPQVARTIARMQDWAYSLSEDAVWVNFFGSNRLTTELPGGAEIDLEQESNYPWDGNVTVRINAAPATSVAVKLRVPAWAARATLSVNREPVEDVLPGSYASVEQVWQPGDTIVLSLPLRVRAMKAHPMVEEARNQMSILRGPIVYALESVDLPEGTAISEIHLPRDPELAIRAGQEILDGLDLLAGDVWRVTDEGTNGSLYLEAGSERVNKVPIQMVPYFAWNNRGTTEMSVWLPVY